MISKKRPKPKKPEVSLLDFIDRERAIEKQLLEITPLEISPFEMRINDFHPKGPLTNVLKNGPEIIYTTDTHIRSEEDQKFYEKEMEQNCSQ